MRGPGKELEHRADMAAKCRSCGTCRSVCPIFAELGIESAVARGKVALIRAVLARELSLTAAFDESIQLCLNCKRCVVECPNNVRVDDLVLSARSDLVAAGRLSVLKRVVIRLLFRRGRLLAPIGKTAAFIQRCVLKGLPPGSALRKLLPLVGIDRDRVFPEFASRTLLESVPERTPASVRLAAGPQPAEGSPGPDPQIRPLTTLPADVEERRRLAREARTVAYFAGCATNLIYPATGRAIVEALADSGVDVIVPRGQGCCSSPVLNMGDFATARAMARRNIAAFRSSGADVVVTGCASCGLTLKREYRELLGIEEGAGLPVYDFTEFLDFREWRPPRAAAADRLRVAYHDPCHLVRGQGISDEPRRVLRTLPWVELVEMRDADKCCGGGGTFSIFHYDLARTIGMRKVEAIREAGVDVVATECPACVMQLTDMLVQAGVDVPVVSVADLVGMGGRPPGPALERP